MEIQDIIYVKTSSLIGIYGRKKVGEEFWEDEGE